MGIYYAEMFRIAEYLNNERGSRLVKAGMLHIKRG